MRSSVENVKPCSLPSMRAVVTRTQSSLAFDSSPISNAPPIDANSSRSASVRAVESFVSTWTGIVSRSSRVRHRRCRTPTFEGLILPPPAGPVLRGRDTSACRGSDGQPIGDERRSQNDGVVAEGHADLGHDAVDVDAEVVGQARPSRCRGRATPASPRVVARGSAWSWISCARRGARRRHAQRERRRRAVLEARRAPRCPGTIS